MKILITCSILLFSYSSFALFDITLDKQCYSEVHRLGCGSAEGANNAKFMKCVDKKINRLSKDCQEYHKAQAEHEHEHDHSKHHHSHDKHSHD